MRPKKISTTVFGIKADGEQGGKPEISHADFATCVKCKRQFTEDEWEATEKENGWQLLPNNPEYESFKIRCSKCNQLNIWTRRKK